MTSIKRVSVESFRSHNKKSIILHPKTTVIIGKNGAGKTSLLEAIYIGLQGNSFKGSDADILKQSKEYWRVAIDFNNEPERIISFHNNKENKKKEFIVNNKKSTTLLRKNKYPIVIFEPEDLQLLHGSPSGRRKFIDSLIYQIDPLYIKITAKYERALKQRNSLLKQGIQNQNHYFAWNITLSEYGASIIARRARIIEMLNKTINHKYHTIANNKDKIYIELPYSPELYTAQKILNDLEDSFHKDIAIKYTSVGPHRHDINFFINKFPALTTASRGEIRTIILSLKYIQSEIIQEVTGKTPIILLDDVFSELDEERQNGIIEFNNQTILTTTTIPDTLIKKKNVKVIKI